MSRKREEFGTDGDAMLRQLLERGGTAATITAALKGAGYVCSTATVGRRMREIRGTVGAPRKDAPPIDGDEGDAMPTAEDLIATIDALPEDASLSNLESLMRDAKHALRDAQAAKNLPLVGQMIRVCAGLAETIRKATPIPPPDPSLNPDFIAAAKRAREGLLKLIDSSEVAP